MKAVHLSIAAAFLTGLLVSGCGVNLEPKDPAARMFLNNCAPCHGADGGGNELYRAPSIAGLDDWYVERQLNHFYDGVRGRHPDDVEGLRMRPMARTFRDRRDQIPAVAKFVANLPVVAPGRTLEGGNVEHGKATFGLCASCHGADGKGLKEMNTPSLVIADDWYILAQLKKFKAGIRGSNPADLNGQTMRATALTLADETAMRDVIAYIKTLPQ